MIMAALWNRAGHYIFALWFLLLSFFFFSIALSQRSQSGCLPYFYTWCGLSVNLECRSKSLKYAARSSLEIHDAKKSPSRHHSTTLLGCIFTTKACIDNWKKNLLSSNTSSTCPCNMVNFGPLTAEIGLGVWGTLANFNGFRVLATLLHGTLVVGVSQTLRRWTEGATYIWQGGHHVGHWPTF